VKASSDDARFQSLFREHRDAMWAYCYRRLASDDVADAVGEVYLTVWRKIDRAPVGDEALPWMYGVARNVVRNSYRSTSRRSRLHQKAATVRHESPETPETQIVRNERDDAILAALGRLTPRDQELVRLRTWEELSHAQIATVTGLSVRSVESKLARSRKKLERLLDVPSSDWVASPRPIEEGGER
jgi:RNA polymerase sigma-70 factor (ECF subfamily)